MGDGGALNMAVNQPDKKLKSCALIHRFTVKLYMTYRRYYKSTNAHLYRILPTHSKKEKSASTNTNEKIKIAKYTRGKVLRWYTLQP